MEWPEDQTKIFLLAFGTTLLTHVSDINKENQVATPVSPLAARLKAALAQHVTPLPGQVSGLIDRVESVGARAGTAINSAHDAVSVAEGLLAQVEEANQAVSELMQIVPAATPAPVATGIPVPASMAAALHTPERQPALADAGGRCDPPALQK